MAEEQGNQKRKVAKIVVDRDLCIGAATCTIVTPELFELDRENKAVVKGGWEKVGLTDEKIIESARSCPVNAITLIDHEGNDIAL